MLIIAFCINGLLLQLVLLSVKYFSFDTTISVKYGNELIAYSASICLPFNVSEGKSKNSLTESLNNVKSVNESDATFNTLDYIFNSIISDSKIKCKITSHEVNDFGLKKCDKPLKSFDYESICFTYKLNLHLKDTLMLHINSKLNDNGKSNANKAKLVIHSQSDLLFHTEDSFMTLIANKEYHINVWNIQFSKSSSHNLCEYYQISYTRVNCVHKCIIESIKSTCNCVPRNAFVAEGDFDANMQLCQQTSSLCHREYYLSEKYCNDVCKVVRLHLIILVIH